MLILFNGHLWVPLKPVVEGKSVTCFMIMTSLVIHVHCSQRIWHWMCTISWYTCTSRLDLDLYLTIFEAITVPVNFK